MFHSKRKANSHWAAFSQALVPPFVGGMFHSKLKANSHWAAFSHALMPPLKLITLGKSINCGMSHSKLKVSSNESKFQLGCFLARADASIEADHVGQGSQLQHVLQQARSNLPPGCFLALADASIEAGQVVQESHCGMYHSKLKAN
jgi:hypothetical protein